MGRDLAKDLIQRLFVEEPRRRGSVWGCLNQSWISPRSAGDTGLRQENQINMDNLRNYQARKRWKSSMKLVFLSSHLSRAKLRGSWLQLIENPPHHGLHGRVQQAKPLSLGGN